jgi:aerobic carbon-monoxide dehydrogenase medium subunit
MRTTCDDGEAIVYGAAVTHAEIEDGAVPDATPGWLASAARRIAYRAVRNRGTIGGSLAHADPAADWVNVLTALGAHVVLKSRETVRIVPLSDFFIAPFATVLARDEIIAGVP